MFEKLTNSKKDVYKVLVQTSENKLPTPDKPWNGVTFKKEAVEKAIDGLKNKMVYDNTISSHAIEHGGMNHTIFGQVIDSEVDSDGNAYAYIDVFNKNYVPVMDRLAENYNNNVRLDEGFSTELDISKNGKVFNPDNSVDLVDYMYTGLVLANNTRDFSGVEGKIVNSIIPSKNENNGGKSMAEPQNVVSNDKYIALVEKRSELETMVNSLKAENKTLKAENAGLKEEIGENKTEITNLNNSINEYKEAGKVEKETLINSILENVPDENKENYKKTLKGMDLDALKLVNSINPQQSNEDDNNLNNGFGGVVAPPFGGNTLYNPRNDVGDTEYEKAHGIDIAKMCADMNKQMSGGN